VDVRATDRVPVVLEAASIYTDLRSESLWKRRLVFDQSGEIQALLNV